MEGRWVTVCACLTHDLGGIKYRAPGGCNTTHLSPGNPHCLLRAMLLQGQKSWLDIEGKWQPSAGLWGKCECMKDLFPGHSDNKICNHQLAKNIYTALPSLSQGACRIGATYWCGQSSSVNKEHQAFWLQRDEKLLILHRDTEKLRFNEKQTKKKHSKKKKPTKKPKTVQRLKLCP